MLECANIRSCSNSAVFDAALSLQEERAARGERTEPLSFFISSHLLTLV